MGELLMRRKALVNAEPDGKIWLFKDGEIYTGLGGLDRNGPNIDEHNQLTVAVGDTIGFSPGWQSYEAVATLVSQNPINASGRTLHITLLTKCSDGRVRNCWFYAYASQSVQEASEIPSATTLADYFPNGDGKYFYIPYNAAAELETELVIPITQDNTYISVGFLKRHVFVSYARVTEMWLE